MHRLLDGAPGEGAVDAEVQRLMTISRICEAFPGALPLQVVRELEDDPELMALTILDLRAYAAAKQAYDRAANKVDDLRAWDGSPLMTLVETYSWELRQERLQRPSL